MYLKWLLWCLVCFTFLGLEAKDTTLILVRHGQAEHNVQDIYNSNPSHPNYTPSHLTPQGREKTVETAHQLLAQGFNPQKISVAYVSPLPRTQETARLLAHEGVISESEVVLDEHLTEVQVGDLEGKPIIRSWESSLTEIYHSETDNQIDARLHQFVHSLQSNNTCDSILIVTHGYIAQRLMIVLGMESKKLEPGEAIILTWQGALLAH